MTTQAETATWPENVLARYLTAGGATVDLTHQVAPQTPPQAYATLAACTGCPASSEHNHHRLVWGMTIQREEHQPEAAAQDARAWAQSHAETCRAMPKPTA